MAKQTKRSFGYVVFVWVMSLLSVGLLLLAGTAVRSDIGQFRSCNSNNSGLVIHACGKSSLNVGDLILFVLFILCAGLVVSLITHSWHATKGEKK
jgi:small-conductance mechanosensitive channel